MCRGFFEKFQSGTGKYFVHRIRHKADRLMTGVLKLLLLAV